MKIDVLNWFTSFSKKCFFFKIQEAYFVFYKWSRFELTPLHKILFLNKCFDS